MAGAGCAEAGKSPLMARRVPAKLRATLDCGFYGAALETGWGRQRFITGSGFIAAVITIAFNEPKIINGVNFEAS
jgi:hypothetical protein